jgi:hypothetical protein
VAEEQARNRHLRAADPASENLAAEHSRETRGRYAAIRCAMDWDRWIPPSPGSIEQLGGQVYWTRVLSSEESPESCGPPPCTELWKCTLFGPPAGDVQNAALPMFNMLATDAVRLILTPTKAEGKALLSRWLIHLADRPEPLVPDSQRRYLDWPRGGGSPLPPIWAPVTPLNPPTPWWAVRLPNVFHLSRVVIEQAIGQTLQ